MQVKEDIVKLLTEVGRDNFEAVKDCRLNSLFRYKLLVVYFPEKFLTVCTRDMMEEICNTMGLPFGNREMVYSNIELRNIKESNPLTRDWNNSVFLGFCRWIGEKRKIDVSFAEEIDDEVDNLQLQGEERMGLVKIRVNQGVFREELLKRYGKCVLCGIKKRELLIASHIKPWKFSEPEEKVDVDNGLISFGDGGEIIISKSLDDIELNDDEINSLLKSKCFFPKEKEKILSKLNVATLGIETAKIIKELNFRIDWTYTDVVCVLEEDDKYALLLNQIDTYKNEELPDLFAELD